MIIIAYLFIAVFASAIASRELSDKILIAGVWGLLWPFMLMFVLFFWWMSRK